MTSSIVCGTLASYYVYLWRARTHWHTMLGEMSLNRSIVLTSCNACHFLNRRKLSSKSQHCQLNCVTYFRIFCNVKLLRYANGPVSFDEIVSFTLLILVRLWYFCVWISFACKAHYFNEDLSGHNVCVNVCVCVCVIVCVCVYVLLLSYHLNWLVIPD